MFVIKVFIYTLLFLLSILLLLLAMPIYYGLKGKKSDIWSVGIEVFGPLGWFRIGLHIDEAGKIQELRIFGIRINLRIDRIVKKADGEKIRKEKKRKSKVKVKTIQKRDTELLKDALREIPRLWKHISPGFIEIQGIYGFDNPYYTGITWAAMSCLSVNSGKQNMNIKPLFHEKMLKGNFDIKGYIVPIYLIYIILKVFIRSMSRKVHNLVFRGKPNRVAHNK